LSSAPSLSPRQIAYTKKAAEIVLWAEAAISQVPLLGLVVFVLLEMISEMVAFFSSAVLTPVAIWLGARGLDSRASGWAGSSEASRHSAWDDFPGAPLPHGSSAKTKSPTGKARSASEPDSSTHYSFKP